MTTNTATQTAEKTNTATRNPMAAIRRRHAFELDEVIQGPLIREQDLLCLHRQTIPGLQAIFQHTPILRRCGRCW
mgnify:CR=1 FL=1